MGKKGLIGIGSGLLVLTAFTGLMVGCSGQSVQGGGDKPTSVATPNASGTTAKVGSYANPGLLAETNELSKLLEDKNVRIVDVRKDSEYKAGHIKGAINIPVEATFEPGAPNGTVGSSAMIESLFSQKGIGNDNSVVVYDGGKDNRASRVFWTLEYFGHTKVSVLNGGFKKWQKEGLATDTAEPAIIAAKFVAKKDESKLTTKEEVLGLLGKPGVALVDARSPQEYNGQDVRSKRGGRIPGAVNADWLNLFTDGDTPVFKSANEIAKMYGDQGVTKDKDVHAY